MSFRLIVFVCVLIGLSSCGGQQSAELKVPGGTWNPNNDAVSEKVAFTASQQSPQQQPISIGRKLIKNGSIEFEVSDVNKTKASITDLVKEFGGYISNDDQNNYGGAPRYSQTVRIPADKLDDFIVKIEGLAKKVDTKNINTQDVTEEFIDVETRLATKKELETRYRELLKQAHTVKDILEVEAQLNNVRGEIESMEGRLKYLTSQVSFSTLGISYYQQVSGNYGFGYRFMNSFGDGWDNLLGFFIGVLTLWPFIILGIVGFWLFRRWRRRRNEQSGN